MRVAAAILLVLIALKTLLGLIGDAEVIANFGTEGTLPNNLMKWFLRLPAWGFFLAGVAFVVFAFWDRLFAQTAKAPDLVEPVHWLVAARYSDWDDIDPLALYQIANLWAGKEPMDTKATEGSAHTMMIRLSEAIRTRKLKIAEVHGENGNKTAEAFLHGAALRQMKPNELADRDIRISRDKLKAYAERIGEKPKFLYPEVRK